MEPSVAILFYGLSFVVALTVLTLLSTFGLMQRLFFRVLVGGSAGTLTANWLQGVTPILSFIESATNGDMGLGGYVALLSIAGLIGTWTYNLLNHQGVLVR